MSFVGGLLERRMDTGPASTLAEPNRTILEAFGGGPVASGVRVSELIAEGIPAVYGCVDILANTIAQIPLKVMRDLDNGGREVDKAHPLYRVLHDRANPETTAFDFRTTLMRWLLLWGNAYAQVVRDSAGRVKALWILRADRMQVSRDKFNRLTYTYRLQDQAAEPAVWTFDANEPPIFHLRINSLDGVLGRSPIRVLREAMGWTLATSQFGQRFFNNNASPRGVLSTDQNFTKEQRDVLRQSWNTVHQGVENAHKIAVLEGNLKFQPIGMPLDDAQFIETMKFQLEEIAGRVYHIPAYMIGHTEKSTSWGTGLEQQSLGFITFTMGPHMVAWSQAIARDLLVRDADTHAAVFQPDVLVKADKKSRMESAAIEIQNGIKSPDEIRAEENQPPRADGRGNEYWQPSNFVVGAPAPTVDETDTDDVPAIPAKDPSGVAA